MQRDDRQLGGVVLVELNWSNHIGLVGLGDGGVDLFGIGRTGGLDGVEQDLRGSIRIRDVLAARQLGLAFEGLGKVGRSGEGK